MDVAKEYLLHLEHQRRAVQPVLFDLIENEWSEPSAREKTDAIIIYNLLSVSTYVGGDEEGDEHEDMDAEDECQVKKSRISSTTLYLIGAITSDRVYEVVKERAAAKEETRRAREDRAAERTTQRNARDLEYVNTFNDFKDIISRAVYHCLTVHELRACLHCQALLTRRSTRRSRARRVCSTTSSSTWWAPSYLGAPLRS
mmetsp:Transcript_25058/g.60561  ORF Transcript_25058/g.60561 Transcript_25058/m.60561 type:complete len:200 (+) Transcript_25058:121-720(+)